MSPTFHSLELFGAALACLRTSSKPPMKPRCNRGRLRQRHELWLSPSAPKVSMLASKFRIGQIVEETEHLQSVSFIESFAALRAGVTENCYLRRRKGADLSITMDLIIMITIYFACLHVITKHLTPPLSRHDETSSVLKRFGSGGIGLDLEPVGSTAPPSILHRRILRIRFTYERLESGLQVWLRLWSTCLAAAATIGFANQLYGYVTLSIATTGTSSHQSIVIYQAYDYNRRLHHRICPFHPPILSRDPDINKIFFTIPPSVPVCAQAEQAQACNNHHMMGLPSNCSLCNWIDLSAPEGQRPMDAIVFIDFDRHHLDGAYSWQLLARGSCSCWWAFLVILTPTKPTVCAQK